MSGCSRKLAFVIWVLSLFSGQVARPAVLPALAQPAVRIFHRKKHVKVWVNTASGIYHCPGTRWYGKTKQGKYMGECKARKAGYRPANYRPCGAECKQ